MNMRFGKLTILDEAVIKLTKGSHKLVEATCDCGNTKQVVFKRLVDKSTASCGECYGNPREWWVKQKFDKLKLADSIDILPRYISTSSSRIFLNVICDCGNIFKVMVRSLFSGHTKSCGKCGGFSKEYWLNKKFGKLHLLDKELPLYLTPQSNKKVWVKCDCGNEKRVIFNVLSKSVSCTKCNLKPKSYWLKQKFGKLALVDRDLPDFISKGNHKKFWFICSCNNKEKLIFFKDVINGKSTSCGCSQAFPGSVSKISKKIYKELSNYIKDLKFSVRNVVKGREFDFYSPSNSIVIEYSGLYWHSFGNLNYRKFSDFQKFIEAKKLGLKYLNIFSDEWAKNKDIFLKLILNACNYKFSSKRIYNFDIVEVDQKEFQVYHDKFHYLSGREVNASLYLLAKYKDQVIGGWSFKKKDINTLDWIRAFWDHSFKAWNPHEKALRYAISKFNCKSVITFSDNRLFDGSMYEKLGFKKVAEIKPDYEYTNGFIRKHKFNFRVKAGIDEKLEAAKKGFFRIYDCGKIKWEYGVKIND